MMSPTHEGGCGEQQLSVNGKIERGEVNVSVRTASKLARALGITLSAMFSELERGGDEPRAE